MLENFFKLSENKTSVRTEVIAGITTFMTMAYILFLNPNILSVTGMDKNAVFFATAVSAGFVTIAMGLIANFPMALAPGMGLNALFATVAVAGAGMMSWQAALGAVFISGIIFLILTVTRVRQILVIAVPASMKLAITAGIGLFITVIGLKLSEIMTVSSNAASSTVEVIKNNSGHALLKYFEWNIEIGSFKNPSVLLCMTGLTITAILMARKVKGALLIGIVLSTIIGIPLGVTKIPDGFSVFEMPKFSNLAVGALDIKGALKMGIWTVIFTFTFVELFDTFGTLVGTAGKAGLLDKDGNSPKIGKAMLVDAFGVSFGALMGTSTITAYVESAAGISEGGRTGLTAIVTGILFILALLLAPLAQLIPNAATAPALIIVGVLMASSVAEIDFRDFTEAFPAFITFTLMPFTYSIANGIAGGIVFYTILKIALGQWKKVHWMMYLLFVLVISRFIFLSE